MYPLVHDFEGERVLVFGGGQVGARRAGRFARTARVVVISPRFAEREISGADLIRADPSPEDVREWVAVVDPVLVVAATDDREVNDAAVAAGRDHGVLVNRADSSDAAGPRTVSIPAVVRQDPVVAAVATGGASPALSRYLRERIEDVIAGAGAVADATATIRSDLYESNLDQEKRQALLQAVVESENVWEAARDSNTDTLAVARAVVETELGCQEGFERDCPGSRQ